MRQHNYLHTLTKATNTGCWQCLFSLHPQLAKGLAAKQRNRNHVAKG